jgi:hypothetical protein
VPELELCVEQGLGISTVECHDALLGCQCRVGLARLIRFLMTKLIYLGSNPKFNMSVVFTVNYSFSGWRRPC